ncbi:KH domain-containing protein [Raphanus sativus]|nr:KH domain-containing protein [Raphanus sativus]
MMMMTSLGGGGGGGGGRFTSSLSVPPSVPQSPNYSGWIRSQSSSIFVEQEKYLSELLAERRNLTPFLPVLPHVCRLLNQEILRVTTMLENATVLSQTGLDHTSPGGIYQNARADMSGWATPFPSERSVPSSPGPNWHNSPGSPSGLIAKRTIRIDIPVDNYPNFNFVGRLLGPRGNSLKRVEASTGCRFLIRGRGSIKDQFKEEMMRGKPGFEHLSEPLHILVEAELPIEIVDARLMQAREVLDELLTPMYRFMYKAVTLWFLFSGGNS